jgi:hypothetical protein
MSDLRTLAAVPHADDQGQEHADDRGEEAAQLAALARHHRIGWVASGLRRAARDAGIELPLGYILRLAADRHAADVPLGVTWMVSGVVIHTLPEGADRLPILLGVTDAEGQWYRRRCCPALRMSTAPTVKMSMGHGHADALDAHADGAGWAEPLTPRSFRGAREHSGLLTE